MRGFLFVAAVFYATCAFAEDAGAAPGACKKEEDCPVRKICKKDKCETAICAQVYKPVCGADGKTYSNACTAQAAHVAVASQGECKQQASPDVASLISAFDKDRTAETPIEAFTADAKVKLAIEQLKKKQPDLTEDGPVQTLVLKGGPCGVVGCPATWLVSQTFHTAGNVSAARTDSVLAIVEVHAEGIVKSVVVAKVSPK